MYSMAIPLTLKISLCNKSSPGKLLIVLTCFDKNHCMESGWDPDVKKFLVRVLNSISLVLLWMIAGATAGIYYQLGFINNEHLIYTIIFYAALILTLVLLLRHLYKTWKS